MKIIYCMCSLYNPGGMERVLLNKVRYLKERMGWDVAVVTTLRDRDERRDTASEECLHVQGRGRKTQRRAGLGL